MVGGVGAGSWGALVAPPLLKATLTLCLGITLFAFNSFLVSTALPSAVADIGGVAWVSWAVTLFFVMSIIGGAAAAVLKQRLGARRVLLQAAAAHGLGTLLAAAAPDMVVLLVGRAFQGLGEGVIAALCYALIPALYPPRLVPKVFGIESMMWATAACLGPLVAGFLTEAWSWRAAFLVNLPATALFMALVPLVVPGRGTAAAGTADAARFPWARLGAIGVGILVLSLASVAPSPGLTGLGVAVSLAILTTTVWRDRHAAIRLFPRDGFSLALPGGGDRGYGRTVGAGIWAILLMNTALAASTVYVALTAQTLWHYRPLWVGALSAGLAVAWSGTAIIVATLGIGAALGRARLVLIRVGPAMVAAGLLSIAWGFAGDVPLAVAAGQLIMGTGCGLGWGFLCQAVMDAADPAERDQASALLPTVQSAGFGIGAALAGLIGNASGYADPGADIGHAAAVVFVAGTVTALAAQIVIFAVRVVRRPAA